MNKKSKKISNFDTPEMFEFLSLMTGRHITNWTQIDGQIIDLDQLRQRNVLEIFKNKLLNKLNKTLVVSEFDNLSRPGEIKHRFHLFYLFQDILKHKNYTTSRFSIHDLNDHNAPPIFSDLRFRINKK